MEIFYAPALKSNESIIFILILVTEYILKFQTNFYIYCDRFQ